MDQVSADDVQSVVFRTARLRVGYRMEDVDAFLDRVATTIAELQRDLSDARDSSSVLRAQCDQLRDKLAASDHQGAHLTSDLDETRILSEEIRLRTRRLLQEQLALLDD